MTAESPDSDIDPLARSVNQVDVAIVGGGIAGLWLLNLLQGTGHTALLFEADRIGCQQTLGSQGMIHGGLKYALTGSLSGASEAIAGMPARWRDCLSGQGEVDLSGLAPLSERYYMFAEDSSLGKLSGFFASRMLRGRIERLQKPDYPPEFQQFDGVVYALNDFVLDTAALLERLLTPVAGQVFRRRIDAQQLEKTDSGWRIRLTESRSGDKSLHARQLILTAGAGNAELLAGLGITEPAMQLRGLRQVVVRHPALQPLYAHCLTGITRAEPTLTITSHPDPELPDGWLWYLGGQLATDGVARDPDQQISHARQELTRCVPWINWGGAEFSCLSWQRAEPAQRGARRPDQAYVASLGGVLVCWPTKLSLAPDLGDRVLAELEPPAVASGKPALTLPHAIIGRLPWTT